MRQYKKFITKGINEPLSKAPFHAKAPIKRTLMLGQNIIPKSNIHLAVHHVNAKSKIPKYSILHKHDADEVNLILSYDKLVYEIQLEDEIYKVSSPSTIFIPRGTRHRADVISGKGFFICLIMSNKYKTT